MNDYNMGGGYKAKLFVVVLATATFFSSTVNAQDAQGLESKAKPPKPSTDLELFLSEESEMKKQESEFVGNAIRYSGIEEHGHIGIVFRNSDEEILKRLQDYDPIKYRYQIVDIAVNSDGKRLPNKVGVWKQER